MMRYLYDEVQRGFCAMCDHPITTPVGKRRICRKPACKREWFREYGARKRAEEFATRAVALQFRRLERIANRIERIFT